MSKNNLIEAFVDNVNNNNYLDIDISYQNLLNEIENYYKINRDLEDELGNYVFENSCYNSINDEDLEEIFDRISFSEKKFLKLNNVEHVTDFNTYSNLTDFIYSFNKNNDNKLYVFKILNNEQSYKDFSIFYSKYALEKKLLSKLPEKNYTEKTIKI